MPDDALPVRCEEGLFPGLGGLLYRRSVLPEPAALARLAVIHGYGEHSGRFREFLNWIAARGVATHAVDLRGHGHSEGRRGAVVRWDEYLEDVASFLGQEAVSGPGASTAPLFILGHSHGGLVVAAAIVRGVVHPAGCVLSAPFLHNRMHVPAWKIAVARVANPIAPWLPLASGLQPEWMSADEAMVEEARRDPLMSKIATPRWFLDSRSVQGEVLRRAGEFQTPLLLMQGEADRIADADTNRRFFADCGATDKTLRLYPELMHELLRETRRLELFAEILDWLRARVGGGETN